MIQQLVNLQQLLAVVLQLAPPHGDLFDVLRDKQPHILSCAHFIAVSIYRNTK